jgi:hypothetical protein
LIQPLREAPQLIRLARGLIPPDAVDAREAQRYGATAYRHSISFTLQGETGICTAGSLTASSFLVSMLGERGAA